MSTYAVVIEDAGSNYSAYVPDLPGCVAVGATVDEVTVSIHDAIELYIAASVECGEEVPRPTSRAVDVDVASSSLRVRSYV
jgi:predicted RNase H-like HicB family nuclease